MMSFLPALALSAVASASTGFRIEFTDESWHLAGFENSLDLSAIAAASPTHILVGSDEMFHIQPGIQENGKFRIESRRPIPLPVEGPVEQAEIDIEGIAWSPEASAYFVTGSHGVGKKKGDVQRDRLSLYRVPVDGRNGDISAQDIKRTSLLPVLRRIPELEPYLHEPLQKNGLNIEGLAARGDCLFFALRAPNIDGDGIVLEISIAAAFGDSLAEPKVHRLPIGEGRGFREIATVRDGFILLTGNASAEASKKIPESDAATDDTRFELLFWDGARSVTKLGTLPENGGKAEALLVLEESPERIKVLVVFDSLLAGAPLSLVIHREESLQNQTKKTMKPLTTLIASTLLTNAALADSDRELRLADCPVEVRATIEANARQGQIEEVELFAIDDRRLYIAEVELAGDLDLTIHVRADGSLVKTVEELATSAYPAFAQELVRERDGSLDEIEKEIASGKTHYLIEIDRKGQADLELVVNEQGTVLRESEEEDD